MGPSLGEAARNADRACDEEDPATFFESLFDGAMLVCGDALAAYLSSEEGTSRPEELARLTLGLMMSYCRLEEGFRGVVGRLCRYLSHATGVRSGGKRRGLPEGHRVN